MYISPIISKHVTQLFPGNFPAIPMSYYGPIQLHVYNIVIEQHKDTEKDRYHQINAHFRWASPLSFSSGLDSLQYV